MVPPSVPRELPSHCCPQLPTHRKPLQPPPYRRVNKSHTTVTAARLQFHLQGPESGAHSLLPTLLRNSGRTVPPARTAELGSQG